MAEFKVSCPNELNNLIKIRANEIGVTPPEYLRMLAIKDISKVKLQMLKFQEEKLFEDIKNINEKLDS